MNVKAAVENCYSFAVTRVDHVTKPMLSPATKDLLPALEKISYLPYRRVLSFTHTSATATVFM